MTVLSRVKYFDIENETFIYQLITAFSVSVVFAPLSFGIVAIIVTAVLWEFVLAGYYRLRISLFPRIAIILVSIIGFILGRYIYGDPDPLSQAKNFSLTREISNFKNYLSNVK